jgi:hypothetical protein
MAAYPPSMGTNAVDIARVVEFRNRLVQFMEAVQRRRSTRYSVPADPDAEGWLRSEQTWLGVEYGRLYNLINAYGAAAAFAPNLGRTSPDVIADAIHSTDHHAYHHLARLTMQHLDTALGRLQTDVSDARTASGAPDRMYRLTSPLYWMARAATFVRWLIGTHRGRITAGIGALILAVVGGIATGWAQAFFERILGGR